MKYLLWLTMFSLSLTSCGDFFQFEEKPNKWDGVTMKILNDSPYVMVGDSMPLKVKYNAPDSLKDTAVYWMIGDNTYAHLQNDTLLALQPGQTELTAIGGGGHLSDKCNVNIIDRWKTDDFNRMHPSDMVIYADIKVDGEQWNDSTKIIGAFVRGELAGLAIKREAFGIRYAEMRIWALADHHVGRVEIRCYDRRKFHLYIFREEIEFSATRTLGTLSNLYPINFVK